MLVQVPLLLKKHLAPTLSLQLKGPAVRKVMGRLGIGTFGIAANQINLLVTTVLATGTQLGALSWLTYAFRLFQLPVGILSVPIANSNLVHFSDLWKEGRKKEAADSLEVSYTLSWFVLVPALCLLYALSSEIVELIFQRGAFDAHDSSQTALALRAYLLGLPFYGLYKLLAPTFFALDRPRVPVMVSIASILANIIFCVFLVPHYGFTVLALGTSVTMVLNSSLLVYFIVRTMGLSFRPFFNLRILNFLASGAGCLMIVLWAKNFAFVWGPSWFALIFNGLLWSIVGGLSYLAFALSLDFFLDGGKMLALLRQKRNKAH